MNSSGHQGFQCTMCTGQIQGMSGAHRQNVAVLVCCDSENKPKALFSCDFKKKGKVYWKTRNSTI